MKCILITIECCSYLKSVWKTFSLELHVKCVLRAFRDNRINNQNMFLNHQIDQMNEIGHKKKTIN